jgi:hypothetical protein
VTLILVMLLVVGLIGASPLALNGFQGAKDHWERLSFIGQTYGAASAILSVLALIGVVATLVFHATCVEVAPVGDRCLVRDSKNPSGPALAFTPSEWDRFLGQIKTDHLNLPRPCPPLTDTPPRNGVRTSGGQYRLVRYNMRMRCGSPRTLAAASRSARRAAT